MTDLYMDGEGRMRWIDTHEPFDSTPMPDYAEVSGSDSGDVPKMILYLGIFVLFSLIYGTFCMFKKEE